MSAGKRVPPEEAPGPSTSAGRPFIFQTPLALPRQPHDFRTPIIAASAGLGLGNQWPRPQQSAGSSKLRQFRFGTPNTVRTPPNATSTPCDPAFVTPPPRSGELQGAAVVGSPSFCVVRGSPANSTRSSLLGGRRLPQTPPSNFNIQAPDVSSESGSSDSSGDEEDVFPAGWGVTGGLRDITARRWRQQSNDNGQGGGYDGDSDQESVLGGNRCAYNAVIRRRRQLLEGRADEGRKDIVLCVILDATRFAASFYDLETSQLFMIPDIYDAGPDFAVLRSIFNQVNPTYVVVSKTSDRSFLRAIHDLTGKVMDDMDQGGDVDEPRVHCSPGSGIQLHILPGKEFLPDICESRVMSLQLPFERANIGSEDRMMFITSLIPFTNKAMIRAIGCLLRFMDKSAIELFQLELVRGQVQVADVLLYKMDDVVIVDSSTWVSLQIFSTDIHPSSFKQGSSSANKEGVSLFSILNGCVTKQGEKALRLMLLRPTRNPNILKRRYDVIDCCINTANFEFVTSVTECLKKIKDIPKLLCRVSLLHATVIEWKQLYQALYHCLLLSELCRSLQTAQVPELIYELGSAEFMSVLRSLTQEMLRIIDFDSSTTSNRIIAKDGLDPELDKKKKQYGCLPEIMAIVASEEMSQLPNYVGQCCSVYIPEVGYLLAVTLWRPDLTDAELKIDNLEYRFKTHELAYYKSPRMRELDVVLGDCSVAILEMETILMVQLTEIILQTSATLHKMSSLVSELDSLIAMSAIAKSNDLIRPEPVPPGGKLQIVNGRHPIAGMISEFVPNSTLFRDEERVVILTGPNASGKSIYLKQIGVIVLMALSGSFVPATFAQIPVYDKICTRVHAADSVSNGFSSFLADVSQMSFAIRSASKATLVIIDEFGKGTLAADGLSILGASIQDFIDRGVNCPTIFLSTHFVSIIKQLRESPLVKYQSMKFLDENGTITYLYELTDGNCETSFAAIVAKEFEISSDVVDRALDMENVTRGRTNAPIQSMASPIQTHREAAVIELAKTFVKTNFNQTNPGSFLKLTKGNFQQLYRSYEPNED